jgi:hypothetical protein
LYGLTECKINEMKGSKRTLQKGTLMCSTIVLFSSSHEVTRCDYYLNLPWCRHPDHNKEGERKTSLYVIHCNQCVGGIDKKDQLLQMYLLEREDNSGTLNHSKGFSAPVSNLLIMYRRK